MTWLKLTRRVLRRIAWSLRAELYQAYRARIVSSELQTKSAGLDQKPWEHCARNTDAPRGTPLEGSKQGVPVSCDSG